MAVNLAPTPIFNQLWAQDLPALQQVFSEIDGHSCPLTFNFHLHTIYSDGRLSPEALMEQAIAIGLTGLAITDHHSVNGYLIAKNWLENQIDAPKPYLWSGIEITAELLGVEVHILGYGFNPQHSSIQPYVQSQAPIGSDCEAVNVISSIQQAGGLAILAHPARYKLPATELIPVAASLGIDGIETYYAYNNPNPWQPSPSQTEEVAELGKIYSLFNTCGTDTHGLNILMRI